MRATSGENDEGLVAEKGSACFDRVWPMNDSSLMQSIPASSKKWGHGQKMRRGTGDGPQGVVVHSEFRPFSPLSPPISGCSTVVRGFADVPDTY